jgi:hypothetical protein
MVFFATFGDSCSDRPGLYLLGASQARTPQGPWFQIQAHSAQRTLRAFSRLGMTLVLIQQALQLQLGPQQPQGARTVRDCEE